MRLVFLMSLLTVSPAMASPPAPGCDPRGIVLHGQALARATQYLGNVAGPAIGYTLVSNDARALQGDAEALARDAQSGATCRELQQGFEYTGRTYEYLQTDHRSAQIAYPNAPVQSAFDSAARSYRYLSAAVLAQAPPPPPPPVTTTVNVDCGSSQYHYRFCPVGGRVVGGFLRQQQSGAACRPGQSFGFTANGVWVDRGCRGIFQLTVQR